MRLNFHLIYFIGFSLFAVSLPLSPFLLSVSQFVLVGNWILEGNFSGKFQLLKKRKGLWVFLLFFLFHLTGMIYTADFYSGIQDLKIKLPLLLLPLIIGTSRPLSERELNRVLALFAIATFISTLICFYYYTKSPFGDTRNISVFISHIRLSILINIAVFSLGYLIFRYYHFSGKGYKIAGFLVICWLIYFNSLLQSVTGIMVFLALIILFVFHFSTFSKSYIIRGILIAFTGLVIIYFAASFVTSIKLFSDHQINLEDLELVTMNGNEYSHYPENREMEGGHYVWLYICEKELEKGWNAISERSYNGTDLREQEIRTTLIRYLTSKGLRKDSSGISELSIKDIRNIENGIASSYYTRKVFPHPRIYQIVWEMDTYYKGADPNGLSVAQRIEYWKNANQIIKKNPIFGVGTGDVKIAFKEQYEKSSSILHEKYRLRAHNQFFTFAIALGVPAMLILLFAMLYPAFSEKKSKFFLVQLIILTAIISMLNEDTLETQAGVSFFAFFYCLFIFGSESIADH